MQLQQLTPMLWVNDVRATLDYYVSILGFDEEAYEAEWDWGVAGKHKVSIMFSRPNAHIPFAGPLLTGSLYLRTDDADAWWSYLKDKAEVFYPIENFHFGMREFAIKDCNGYILQFGQRIS